MEGTMGLLSRVGRYKQKQSLLFVVVGPEPAK